MSLLRFIVVAVLHYGALFSVKAWNSSNAAIHKVLQDQSSLIYSEIYKMTSNFTNQLAQKLDFCITDIEEETNLAFNYSSNTDFISACLLETDGDMVRRLCSAAELRFYYEMYLTREGSSTNKNCNTGSWNSGCEPGWASATSTGSNTVYVQSTNEIPSRTTKPRPCCEGFFCPRGLTCMIPCPLGAYCPHAKLNRATGYCDPYSYTLPYGGQNHTCGGADLWGDIGSTKQIFCSAGFYCPTNIQKNSCSRGHYCRLGATSQSNCYPLIRCGRETKQQSIYTYGIFLIVTVLALLLLIYTCSDQLLVIRERRKAKSRQAAALLVREKIRARERWRLVREAAKNEPNKLRQFRSTFTKRQQLNDIEKQEMLGTSSRVYSDQFPIQSTQSLVGHDDVYESDHASVSGYGEIELASSLPLGSNEKKTKLSPSPLDSRSYVFEYAYAEIEKEKVRQNSPLTFTELIKQAGSSGAQTRPTVEVIYKELNLTLKGNGTRLLRNMTGALMPGHITAVMGPSGAGKTSLLNALAGKLSGCVMTGSVLINGRPNSIDSYRKIVGFVPQDDIIHGNLTVEENFWFSARCRLPVNMLKEERVLVVERVIEALGLQSVRTSLVGTVEKRGISGGQRKRVNVGIELVMQPSLLFLDEPTSGLDSSSSILLLKALRREALGGSNICMVVHQPSFALFRMFDDLKLLTKGGMTVYDGSVDDVEQYFSTLGIVTPDRINPPDYFMDILEGIAKPQGNHGFDCSILPVKWMEYKGYEIPAGLQDSFSSDGNEITGFKEVNIKQKRVKHDKSFIQDLLEEMCHSIQSKYDDIKDIFTKAKDLSGRQTPNFFKQLRYFLERVAKQRFRESNLQAKDYLILMLGGACLGMLASTKDESFAIIGYIYTLIALPLLCMISALRTFSLDKLQYWRESAAGMSKLAFFLAKDTVDHFNTAIKPLLYLTTFYFFSNPRSTFLDNYVVTLVLIYCVVGLGYIFAMTLDPGPAQLCSALFPVVFTLISTQTTNQKVLIDLMDLVYAKWALEAYTIANIKRYTGVWLISRCGYLGRKGYNLNYWVRCLLILIGFGVVFRIFAFLCLIAFNRKRQR